MVGGGNIIFQLPSVLKFYDIKFKIKNKIINFLYYHNALFKMVSGSKTKRVFVTPK